MKRFDEVNSCRREFVRVPAAVALGSGHDAVARNKIVCLGSSFAVRGAFVAAVSRQRTERAMCHFMSQY